MKQKSKNVINLDELPEGIVELIFSKLMFVHLPICMQVCKSWRNLVLTSKFHPINQFVSLITTVSGSNLHCIDFGRVGVGVGVGVGGGMNIVASFTIHPTYSSAYLKIVNSCRGLLLCSFTYPTHEITQFYKTHFCILNPITNEYLDISSHNNKNFLKYYYGLGFSPNTKQFKIVRHSRHKLSYKSLASVEIFAFGTSCSKWTTIGILPLVIETNGAYFNGALYWVGVHMHLHKVIYFICRLDLEDYKLDQFCVPKHGLDICDTFFFGVFNDAFYLTFHTSSGDYQVWQMEEDFSWIIVFVVLKPRLSFTYNRDRDRDRSFHLQLIKVCEDGNILCLLAGLVLLLCDPKTGTTQILMDQTLVIKKHLEVYPIDSFNFDSLRKILVGDG